MRVIIARICGHVHAFCKKLLPLGDDIRRNYLLAVVQNRNFVMALY